MALPTVNLTAKDLQFLLASITLDSRELARFRKALQDIQTMSEGTCSELVASIHRIATEALNPEGE